MIAPLCLDLKSDAFTLSCTQIDEMKLRLEFEIMVISFVMPQVLCEEADPVSESLIARSPIELCHSGLKGRVRFAPDYRRIAVSRQTTFHSQNGRE
jgi:hypothetical protein